MLTLPTLLRRAAATTGGILLAACMIGMSVGLVVSGSFALEAWTGWSDLVTIGIMIALGFFAPAIGFIIGVIGLFYLPIW